MHISTKRAIVAHMQTYLHTLHNVVEHGRHPQALFCQAVLSHSDRNRNYSIANAIYCSNKHRTSQWPVKQTHVLHNIITTQCNIDGNINTWRSHDAGTNNEQHVKIKSEGMPLHPPQTFDFSITSRLAL